MKPNTLPCVDDGASSLGALEKQPEIPDTLPKSSGKSENPHPHMRYGHADDVPLLSSHGPLPPDPSKDLWSSSFAPGSSQAHLSMLNHDVVHDMDSKSDSLSRNHSLTRPNSTDAPSYSAQAVSDALNSPFDPSFFDHKSPEISNSHTTTSSNVWPNMANNSKMLKSSDFSQPLSNVYASSQYNSRPLSSSDYFSGNNGLSTLTSDSAQVSGITEGTNDGMKTHADNSMPSLFSHASLNQQPHSDGENMSQQPINSPITYKRFPAFAPKETSNDQKFVHNDGTNSSYSSIGLKNSSLEVPKSRLAHYSSAPPVPHHFLPCFDNYPTPKSGFFNSEAHSSSPMESMSSIKHESMEINMRSNQGYMDGLRPFPHPLDQYKSTLNHYSSNPLSDALMISNRPSAETSSHDGYIGNQTYSTNPSSQRGNPSMDMYYTPNVFSNEARNNGLSVSASDVAYDSAERAYSHEKGYSKDALRNLAVADSPLLGGNNPFSVAADHSHSAHLFDFTPLQEALRGNDGLMGDATTRAELAAQGHVHAQEDLRGQMSVSSAVNLAHVMSAAIAQGLGVPSTSTSTSGNGPASSSGTSSHVSSINHSYLAINSSGGETLSLSGSSSGGAASNLHANALSMGLSSDTLADGHSIDPSAVSARPSQPEDRRLGAYPSDASSHSSQSSHSQHPHTPMFTPFPGSQGSSGSAPIPMSYRGSGQSHPHAHGQGMMMGSHGASPSFYTTNIPPVGSLHSNNGLNNNLGAAAGSGNGLPHAGSNVHANPHNPLLSAHSVTAHGMGSYSLGLPTTTLGVGVSTGSIHSRLNASAQASTTLSHYPSASSLYSLPSSSSGFPAHAHTSHQQQRPPVHGPGPAGNTTDGNANLGKPHLPTHSSHPASHAPTASLGTYSSNATGNSLATNNTFHSHVSNPNYPNNATHTHNTPYALPNYPSAATTNAMGPGSVSTHGHALGSYPSNSANSLGSYPSHNTSSVSHAMPHNHSLVSYASNSSAHSHSSSHAHSLAPSHHSSSQPHGHNFLVHNNAHPHTSQQAGVRMSHYSSAGSSNSSSMYSPLAGPYPVHSGYDGMHGDHAHAHTHGAAPHADAGYYHDPYHTPARPAEYINDTYLPSPSPLAPSTKLDGSAPTLLDNGTVVFPQTALLTVAGVERLLSYLFTPQAAHAIIALSHAQATCERDELDSRNADIPLSQSKVSFPAVQPYGPLKHSFVCVRTTTQVEPLTIVHLCKTQLGSRVLQTKILHDRDGVFSNFVFYFIFQNLIDLACNLFGNYLIQSLIDRASVPQRIRIMSVLIPRLICVACDKHGTRVIQRLVERATTAEERALLMDALRGGPSVADLPHAGQSNNSKDRNRRKVTENSVLANMGHACMSTKEPSSVVSYNTMTVHVPHEDALRYQAMVASKEYPATVRYYMEHALDPIPSPFYAPARSQAQAGGSTDDTAFSTNTTVDIASPVIPSEALGITNKLVVGISPPVTRKNDASIPPPICFITDSNVPVSFRKLLTDLHGWHVLNVAVDHFPLRLLLQSGLFDAIFSLAKRLRSCQHGVVVLKKALAILPPLMFTQLVAECLDVSNALQIRPLQYDDPEERVRLDGTYLDVSTHGFPAVLRVRVDLSSPRTRRTLHELWVTLSTNQYANYLVQYIMDRVSGTLEHNALYVQREDELGFNGLGLPSSCYRPRVTVSACTCVASGASTNEHNHNHNREEDAVRVLANKERYGLNDNTVITLAALARTCQERGATITLQAAYNECRMGPKPTVDVQASGRVLVSNIIAFESVMPSQSATPPFLSHTTRAGGWSAGSRTLFGVNGTYLALNGEGEAVSGRYNGYNVTMYLIAQYMTLTHNYNHGGASGMSLYEMRIERDLLQLSLAILSQEVVQQLLLQHTALLHDTCECGQPVEASPHVQPYAPEAKLSPHIINMYRQVHKVLVVGMQAATVDLSLRKHSYRVVERALKAQCPALAEMIVCEMAGDEGHFDRTLKALHAASDSNVLSAGGAGQGNYNYGGSNMNYHNINGGTTYRNNGMGGGNYYDDHDFARSQREALFRNHPFLLTLFDNFGYHSVLLVLPYLTQAQVARLMKLIHAFSAARFPGKTSNIQEKFERMTETLRNAAEQAPAIADDTLLSSFMHIVTSRDVPSSPSQQAPPKLAICDPYATDVRADGFARYSFATPAPTPVEILQLPLSSAAQVQENTITMIEKLMPTAEASRIMSISAAEPFLSEIVEWVEAAATKSLSGTPINWRQANSTILMATFEMDKWSHINPCPIPGIQIDVLEQAKKFRRKLKKVVSFQETFIRKFQQQLYSDPASHWSAFVRSPNGNDVVTKIDCNNIWLLRECALLDQVACACDVNIEKVLAIQKLEDAVPLLLDENIVSRFVRYMELKNILLQVSDSRGHSGDIARVLDLQTPPFIADHGLINAHHVTDAHILAQQALQAALASGTPESIILAFDARQVASCVDAALHPSANYADRNKRKHVRMQMRYKGAMHVRGELVKRYPNLMRALIIDLGTMYWMLEDPDKSMGGADVKSEGAHADKDKDAAGDGAEHDEGKAVEDSNNVDGGTAQANYMCAVARVHQNGEAMSEMGLGNTIGDAGSVLGDHGSTNGGGSVGSEETAEQSARASSMKEKRRERRKKRRAKRALLSASLQVELAIQHGNALRNIGGDADSDSDEE